MAAAAAAKAALDARTAAVREAEQNIAVAQSAVDQANQRITQADASIRICHDRAEAGGGERSAREIGPAQVAQKKALLEQAQAEPQLLHHRRSGNRDRRQEDRRDWARTFLRASS